MKVKRLADIDFGAMIAERKYYPSPMAWEDQVLYFILVDRFSDNKENLYKDLVGNTVKSGETQPYNVDNCKIKPEEYDIWVENGETWCGGNLRGIISKLGYLKRLGVSALWVSPIFKQVSHYQSYHGYGIQNFLEIDPHFGTKEDLVELVKIAHENGIYVLLDIILNHTGDVFGYDSEKITDGRVDGDGIPIWNGKKFPAKGFKDSKGNPTIPFVKNESLSDVDDDSSIWPIEFQDPDIFSRKGKISNWDYYPEYLEGDFFGLKDISLGEGGLDSYTPSKALLALCAAYKYWMAYADIDGFRIDTVKHMDKGATRFFTTAIHEFASKIGKENFYLLGEITGGRDRAFQTLEETGINAALAIDDIQIRMENTVKGLTNPEEFFDLFRNSVWVGKDSHKWFRNKIVSMLDDHDKVVECDYKTRFCAGDASNRQFLLAGLAFNLTTIGIPCIYYGTEQGFDGEGKDVRFIREAMFGGNFGAFRSKNGHFFNEDTYEYQELSKILKVARENIAIRRGRQYLREISSTGKVFGYPSIMFGDKMLSVVPWSRVLDDEEILLAINTDPNNSLSCWVTVDGSLNNVGDAFNLIYPEKLDSKTIVKEVLPGRIAINITVPPHGIVIYKR